MNSSSRIAAAVFVAIAAAGVVGWAIHREMDDATERVGDGTPVREPDRAERPTQPVARTTQPELAGARPIAVEPAYGRRRVLGVIVEGPSGRIVGATVTVEADPEFYADVGSIAPPEPGRVRPVDRSRTAVTDARGRASFVLFADEMVSILVAAMGYTSRTTTHWFASDEAPRTLEEAVVRLKPATRIDGRVVDAGSGRPIEAVEVDGGDADETRTKTDVTGAFRLWTDVTLREVRLFVHAEGYVDGAIDLQTWNGVVEPASITVALRRPAARGSLEVVVRDPKGRPVRSASVSVDPAEEMSDDAQHADAGVEATDGWRERGTTDGEGVLRIARVPLDRDFLVSAFAPGLAEGRAASPARLDAAQPTARVEITLGELASLTVTLLDPDGLPTSGRVTADFHHTAFRGAGAPVGDFEFRGVEPGEVRVVARHPQHLRRVETIELRAGENRMTMRLGRGVAIRGTVVDRDGKPLRRVLVTASPDVSDAIGGDVRQARTVLTDADGGFACVGLEEGRHVLRALRRPESSDDASLVGTGGAEAPADGVRLVARPLGSIRATLLRPNSTPYEGGLDFWVESRGLIEQQRSPVVEAGRVRVQELADGDWIVGLSVGGYAPILVPFSIRDGQEIDLGTLRLGDGVTVRGRVVDAAGRPVDSASVSIGRASVVSREDGAFELDLVAKGRQTLKALAEGFVTTTTTIDVGDDGPVLEVRLSRGGIVRGTLQGFRQGGPDGTFRFAREAHDPQDTAEPVDVTLRSDGRFFVPLGPGRWKAEWTPTDEAARVLGSVSVEESQVRDVDFTLPTK